MAVQAASFRRAAMLAAVFDSAPDAIAVLDGQGRLVECNAAYEALWNPPPQARADSGVLQQWISRQLVDPDAYDRTISAAGAGSPGYTTTLMSLRDGRCFERHLAPMPAAGRGAVVVRWRDVSSRQRAEAARLELTVQAQREQARERELSAKLELAMASAGIEFWEIDMEDEVATSTTTSWLGMLGYQDDDLPHTAQAWDGLVHPDDYERREAAWVAHVEGRSPSYEVEFRIRHKSGGWVWLLARGRAVARDSRGRATRVVGVRMDITRRKQAERLLEQQAYTDGLTGALNRRRFFDLGQVELERARRHNQPLSLLIADLDHFKQVNDSLGHAAGDAVLQSFADLGRSLMRASDLFARIGGEEFAALLPHTDAEGAAALAERLRHLVNSQPVGAWGPSARYTVSIGVAGATGAADLPANLDALLRHSDDALYRAKREGRDRVAMAAAGSAEGPPAPLPPADTRG